MATKLLGTYLLDTLELNTKIRMVLAYIGRLYLDGAYDLFMIIFSF